MFGGSPENYIINRTIDGSFGLIEIFINFSINKMKFLCSIVVRGMIDIEVGVDKVNRNVCKWYKAISVQCK